MYTQVLSFLALLVQKASSLALHLLCICNERTRYARADAQALETRVCGRMRAYADACTSGSTERKRVKGGTKPLSDDARAQAPASRVCMRAAVAAVAPVI